MFSKHRVAYWSCVGLLIVCGVASAAELPLRVQGGATLTISAVADKQAWQVVGDHVVLAAVVKDQLLLKVFDLPFSDPPQPGPTPPQPGGPLQLFWIEETSRRTAGQASAIMDAEVRKALAAAKWTMRVADVDIVDETGAAPADLQPYIQDARIKGLPRLYVVDAAGAEVYAGDAPANVQAFRDVLTKIGLPTTWKILPIKEEASNKTPARKGSQCDVRGRR